MPIKFSDAVKRRRSCYVLGNKMQAEEEVTDLVNFCVKNAPSPFNSQSARVAVLFGKNHSKFWDIVMNTLRTIVPADKFGPTEEKIKAFAKAYGTVLYFDDTKTVESLQKQFPSYSDKFPVWAQQSNGMLQYMVWTGLAAHDIGASLQHYNPIIDDETKKTFGIPREWQLIAQMPFGSICALPEPKTFLPLEERVKVFK